MKSLISGCCGCALVVVVVLTSSTLIFAQEKGDDSAPENPPAETGILFVEGQYVSPPYIFRADESGVSVNGISLEYTSLGLGEQDFFKWEMVPREATSTSDQAEPEVTYRRKPIRPRYPLRNVEPPLRSEHVVVIFSDERPAVLQIGPSGCKLLTLLARNDGSEVVDVDWKDFSGVSGVNREKWRSWIETFEPTSEFRDRVRTKLQERAAFHEKELSHIAARRRLETSSYPLTVVGMLLVVAAAGHLLSYRPTDATLGQTTPFPTGEHRSVVKCLLLVVGLSALDLVWTLLAHQAGAIKELNPLGARFVDDAQMLIAFKVIATAVAVGILFATRHSLVARRACWWSCLVCTLLGARWLSLTSAFV